MAKLNRNSNGLQPYPRIPGSLLADPSLFPLPVAPLNPDELLKAIDTAFLRSKKNKRGEDRPLPNSAQEMASLCLTHLRERSDPTLTPSFVAQLEPTELFDLDAVSHEMQRHRMTIGVFYQYLLLELMRLRWSVFDGHREGDIVADLETPGYTPGLRVYMSVKKSIDTVGGQDIAGAIQRLESMAKQEKNLTRPYLCVMGIATPSKGRLRNYQEDRKVKQDSQKRYPSLNCEVWGPGFIFPFVAGLSAKDVYLAACQRVSQHLPFLSLNHRLEASRILADLLEKKGLLAENGRVHPQRFLHYITGES